MKRIVSVVRLIVATRSSGPPASQPVIKEMPGLVASRDTLYFLHYIMPVISEPILAVKTEAALRP